MPPLLRLCRPKQWSKNLLVFAAWIFSGNLTNGEANLKVFLAFLAMCAASSATYIFNDLADIERDRAHPTKKNRPLAAGTVGVPLAWVTAALLVIFALGIGFWLSPWAGVILLGYGALQGAYNLGLKHMAVLDVFAIAFGFLLRAGLGAEAIQVPISGWLMICTGALALTLGFAKRRSEWVKQGEDRERSRESLGDYDLMSLNMLVALSAGLALVFYGIYVVQSETAVKNPGLLLTYPFVIYGVFRYLVLSIGKNEGGEPEELLIRDRHILLSVVAFVLVAALVIKTGVHVPLIESAGR